ncbi:MAG TPA: hypothetical protein VK031_01615, partial [Tissierellaceae bacterium]|nr:hypothetical protein [Tissierellaceae bacterium]
LPFKILKYHDTVENRFSNSLRSNSENLTIFFLSRILDRIFHKSGLPLQIYPQIQQKDWERQDFNI